MPDRDTAAWLQRCSACLSMARDGAWIHRGGQVLYVNDALCELLQHPREDIVGHEIYEFLPAEIRDAVRARVANARALPGSTPVAEFSMRCADGSRLEVEAWGHALPDAGDGAVLAWIRPIGPRKQMEGALASSQRRLKAIFDALTEGVVLQDAQAHIVEFNPAATRILGLTEDQLAGRQSTDPRWQAIHEDGSPFPGEDHPAMHTLRTGKPARDVVMGVRKPDGSTAWISINVDPLFEPTGAVAGVVCSFADITRRKEADRQLEMQRRLNQRIFDTAPIGLAIYGDDGRCWAANETMAGHVGATIPQVLALNYNDIASWKRTGALDLVQRALKSSEPLRMEMRAVTTWGKEVWLELTCRHLDLGGADGVMLMTRDLSDARRAEQALAASEARYRMLVQQATDGIFTAAQDGRYTSVNDAGCRMLGYAREEILGMRMDDLVVIGPSEPPVQYERLRSGDPILSERRLRRKDGSVMLAEISGRLLPDGQFLGIVRDIGPRKAAEDALRAKEVAERSSAAKTEFISKMSHELRTPLNAILGFAELLLSGEHPVQHGEQRRALDLIRRSGQHLLLLIDDLLDLTRIEAGTLNLNLQDLDLRELVRETVAELSLDAQRAGVQLLAMLPDEPLPLVRGDRTRLRQVLSNLLTNAIKYNRAGGSARVVLASTGGRLSMSVCDDGPGLTPAQLAGLFQPFNRLGAETSAVPGTGIGLVITRRLVEMMGGELRVASEPSRGCEFSVDLQAVSTPNGPAPTLPAEARSLARREDVRGRVLYVDDDEVNRLLMQAYLDLRPAVRLALAVDGASALAAVARERPDLLLVDMTLPDMNGLALLRALHARPEMQGVPCIAVSANAMPEDIASARAAGFHGYLTKPLPASDLLAAVDALLAVKPA